MLSSGLYSYYKQKAENSKYFLSKKYSLDSQYKPVYISDTDEAPHTDGETIKIGFEVFNSFNIKDEEDFFGKFTRFVSHEMGHINFTYFKNFKNFLESVYDKYSIHPEITKNIFNTIEDGRVDRKMAETFLELKDLNKKVNTEIYSENVSKMSVFCNPLEKLFIMIVEYATFQDNIYYKPNDKELYEYMEKIKPIIDKARLEDRKEKVRQYTEMILLEILPLIIDYSENYKNYGSYSEKKQRSKKRQEERDKMKNQDVKELIKRLREGEKSCSKRRYNDNTLEKIRRELQIYDTFKDNDIKDEEKNKNGGKKDVDDKNADVEKVLDINMNENYWGVTFDIEYPKMQLLKKSQTSESKKLKKSLERILIDRKFKMTGYQQKGNIDLKKLAYIKKNLSDNVFTKKVRQNENDCSISIIIDGSGSMKADKKDKYAFKAVEDIEEALKNIASTRIILYRAEDRKIKTVLIKDFNDKKNINYTYSYKKDYPTSDGGNAEYVNIVNEANVLRNQISKKKLMIVLSDGYPNEINRKKKAVEMLKDSISYVRKQGINPISIMYLTKREQNGVKKSEGYLNLKEAFGAGSIVISNTENIYKDLVKIIKKSI